MYTRARISEYLKCATKEAKNISIKQERSPHESATSFVHRRTHCVCRLRSRCHRYQQTALKCRATATQRLYSPRSLFHRQVTVIVVVLHAFAGGVAIKINGLLHQGSARGGLLRSKLYFGASGGLDPRSGAVVCLRLFRRPLCKSPRLS